VIRLKLTWSYCLAFYCIGMLYASLHELVHHFAGALLCGAWGYKSFNYFETACEGTARSWYATYAGPLFTYAVMYVGAWFLLRSSSNYRKHLGFAMIFAQLPLQRMTSPFFHMNDEYAATVNLFGHSALNYWLVILVIWLVCVPPLWIAYRAIENRRRALWFLFYLVLFPYVLVGPFFFTLEYLMVTRGVLAQTFIGIGWLFIINEIVTIVLYVWARKFIDPDWRTPPADSLLQPSI
jgi:hypothetical protein